MSETLPLRLINNGAATVDFSIKTGSFLQPKPKKGKKKVAAAPLAAKKPEPKKTVNPLIEKRPRNFGIGEYLVKYEAIRKERRISRCCLWKHILRVLVQPYCHDGSLNFFT